MPARNVVKAVCSTSPDTPGRLPAAVPTSISARATAMPARMLTIEARRASATQTAAIVYVFNCYFLRLYGLAAWLFRRGHQPGPTGGPAVQGASLIAP